MHRSRLKPRLVSHPLCAPMTSKNAKRVYTYSNQILSPLSYCLYTAAISLMKGGVFALAHQLI